MIRANVVEDREATMARFLNVLNRDMAMKVESNFGRDMLGQRLIRALHHLGSRI